MGDRETLTLPHDTSAITGQAGVNVIVTPLVYELSECLKVGASGG